MCKLIRWFIMNVVSVENRFFSFCLFFEPMGSIGTIGSNSLFSYYKNFAISLQRR